MWSARSARSARGRRRGPGAVARRAGRWSRLIRGTGGDRRPFTGRRAAAGGAPAGVAGGPHRRGRAAFRPGPAERDRLWHPAGWRRTSRWSRRWPRCRRSSSSRARSAVSTCWPRCGRFPAQLVGDARFRARVARREWGRELVAPRRDQGELRVPAGELNCVGAVAPDHRATVNPTCWPWPPTAPAPAGAAARHRAAA